MNLLVDIECKTFCQSPLCPHICTAPFLSHTPSNFFLSFCPLIQHILSSHGASHHTILKCTVHLKNVYTKEYWSLKQNDNCWVSSKQYYLSLSLFEVITKMSSHNVMYNDLIFYRRLMRTSIVLLILLFLQHYVCVRLLQQIPATYSEWKNGPFTSEFLPKNAIEDTIAECLFN